jgi:AAA+ superfamily predicted ATPase
LASLNELIEHSKNTKKLNLAIQLQSILKDSIRLQQSKGLVKVGSPVHFQRLDERETDDLILEKITSDYTFDNLIGEKGIKSELKYFVREHDSTELLQQYGLPVANKILLHGPSGCGKTLASYVIAGELKKMMIVVNLGAIVSAKLGETSKNLAKLFRKASAEDCIIFIDEFDSLGKVRDYSQDHGEMKRVVNTILQLFDYLPQSSILVAATNQLDMIDNALLRRFDLSLKFDLPTEKETQELINLTLKNGKYKFDKPKAVAQIVTNARGLSYYSIQKTIVTAIKRSLFERQEQKNKSIYLNIKTDLWAELIDAEKKALSV